MHFMLFGIHNTRINKALKNDVITPHIDTITLVAAPLPGPIHVGAQQRLTTQLTLIACLIAIGVPLLSVSISSNCGKKRSVIIISIL